MALQPHLKNFLHMVSTHAIATSPSPLTLASQKTTTLKKRYILGIALGNFTLQHLHVKSYNSYCHC